MLKRNGCVYTQIIKHCSTEALLPVIRDFGNMNETEFLVQNYIILGLLMMN